MQQVWPLLDPEDLDGTFRRWLTAVRPIISTQRVASSRLAENYLRAFKAIELGAAATLPAMSPAPLAAEVVATSLLVTGPVQMKRQMAAGVPLTTAADVARATSARSAMRHVLTGGRSLLLDTIEADRQALGWARVTSGKPCSFCAMVASRGPVYKGRDSAEFKAHDGCSCTVEPVYRPDAQWPTGSQRWADLWQQAKDADGETTNVFRQLVAAA